MPSPFLSHHKDNGLIAVERETKRHKTQLSNLHNKTTNLEFSDGTTSISGALDVDAITINGELIEPSLQDIYDNSTGEEPKIITSAAGAHLTVQDGENDPANVLWEGKLFDGSSTSFINAKGVIRSDFGGDRNIEMSTPGNDPGVTMSLNADTATTGFVRCNIRNSAGSVPTGAGAELFIDYDNTGVRLINGNTSWTGTSDRRVKKNIEEVGDCCAGLATLKAYKFNYLSQTDGDKKHIGVMADEVQIVYPEVVEEFKERDDDGNEIRAILGVTYDKLIPVLIGAINEISAEVKKLKKKKTDGGES